jgi:dTDP-4-dehydrorhamnose reductase
MKVLIFGANGMAGHLISSYLKKAGVSVSTVARSNADYCLDIENVNITRKFLEEVSQDYDYIINCIGLLVKDSISRPDRAILINSWFPHAIEDAIKDSKTRLIHLSTDCVFDGTRGNYTESDIHTETNFYGSSKSLGEVNNSKDITFRMSIIGPETKPNGSGLFDWCVNNKEIDIFGWDNAIWNGITTLELAKCIYMYINDPKISGVYHLVNNNNSISKYELLSKINCIFNLNKNVIRSKSSKDINKVLIDTRNNFNFNISDYDTQLIELKNFILNKSLHV